MNAKQSSEKEIENKTTKKQSQTHTYAQEKTHGSERNIHMKNTKQDSRIFAFTIRFHCGVYRGRDNIYEIRVTILCELEVRKKCRLTFYSILFYGGGGDGAVQTKKILNNILKEKLHQLIYFGLDKTKRKKKSILIGLNARKKKEYFLY